MPKKKEPRKPCQVDGCNRISMYLRDELCQKHYFRRMRGGTFEKRLKAKAFYTHSAGYILVKMPGHPLANKQGLVYQHRAVMYEIHGDNLSDCEMCGAPLEGWRSRQTHVDHINMDKKDNRASNLRIVCNSCNVSRGGIAPCWKRSTSVPIELDGVIKTATEWAREPGCKVCGATIRRRFLSGEPAIEAIFKPRRIKKEKPATPPKHTRKNAVVAIIDGDKRTAAEWSRHPRCAVTENTIINRIRSGVEHEQAVFAPPRSI